MKRIVLDQGLPATAAMILRAGGWDAAHVREIAMNEATDGEILDYAARESRVAITLDRDFPEILALTGTWLPGVDSNRESFRLSMIGYDRAPQVHDKGNRGASCGDRR